MNPKGGNTVPYEGDNMMDIKRTNRSAALRILHEKGGMSRKRLAENIKLTPAAITKIVGEMLGEGLLVESGTVPSESAGRREILVELNTHHRCALGILLNLRQAIVSAVWLDGSVLFSEPIELPSAASAEETVALLSGRLLALAKEHGLEAERVIGLGLAVRGITSADGRTLSDSFGMLDERDVPLCRLFEEATGFPTVMANNVRALFSAQLFFDRDEEESSEFFLRCEVGIGAALSINRQIWPGVSRQCAEIGHIPVVRRGGKRCSCGKKGCLETVASPSALREDALALRSETQTPIFWALTREKAPEDVTIEDVLQAAERGDAAINALLDRAVTALGDVVKTLVYLVDPGAIVLYGRMFDNAACLSRLLREIEKGIDGRHRVRIERSPYNHRLEDKAAGLLVVDAYMNDGGIQS